MPVAAVLKIITSFFYRKLMARETRIVEVIRSRAALADLAERFPSLTNATVVLLVEPGALDWSDLPLVQRAATAALDAAVALETVTPDGVAGALATAAGIPTTTIPMTLGPGTQPAAFDAGRPIAATP